MRKMVCALCLRKVTPETSVYSTHRQVRYCAPPWTTCDRIRLQIIRREEARRKKEHS